MVIILTVICVVLLIQVFFISKKKNSLEDQVDCLQKDYKKLQESKDQDLKLLKLGEIDRFRSFKDLKLNEIFICIDIYNDVEYRTVIHTPNNKFQIVQISKDGKVNGGIGKEITTSMEDMIRLISEEIRYFRMVTNENTNTTDSI